MRIYLNNTRVIVSNTNSFVEFGYDSYRLRYILSLPEFNKAFFGKPTEIKLWGFTLYKGRKDWKYHLKKAIVDPHMENYYFKFLEDEPTEDTTRDS